MKYLLYFALFAGIMSCNTHEDEPIKQEEEVQPAREPSSRGEKGA